MYDEYDTLYFYDAQYEAGVCNRNCSAPVHGADVERLVPRAEQVAEVYTVADQLDCAGSVA